MGHDVWPVAERSVDRIPELPDQRATSQTHQCMWIQVHRPAYENRGKENTHFSGGWGHPSLPLWKLCPWGAGCPQEGALAPPSPLPPPANAGEKGRMLLQGFLSSEVSWNLWSGGQVSVGMTPSVSSWSKLKHWWRIQRNSLHRGVDGDGKEDV